MSTFTKLDSTAGVYAVIITFNPELNIFSRQLLSLKNQVDFVIIVDNSSNNINLVQEMAVQILPGKSMLIKNQTNLGLGKAQNSGINEAKIRKASHVLLLDQDSVLDDNFVIGLLNAEQTLKNASVKVAAIGPVYYNENTGEKYPITKYRGPFIKRIIPDKKPVEATFLIASGCLIPLEVIDEVGLMNEDLFIDYIDVEWSFRAKSKGFDVYAAPESKMMHTIGDNRTSIFGRSISVHSPLRRYYLYRNSIYMVKNKGISVGYKIREVTFNAFRFVIFLALSRERGKYFKYSIAGFRDGFKGVVGKCPHTFN